MIRAHAQGNYLGAAETEKWFYTEEEAIKAADMAVNMGFASKVELYDNNNDLIYTKERSNG